ncbi:MAG: LuxR C-terminal-related transcriptional regulator, partial [Dehalococcoidales bacterium]
AVLVLLAKEITNKGIGHSLYISENTVKVHIVNIMRKLQIHSRLELGIYAIKAGLLQSPYLR